MRCSISARRRCRIWIAAGGGPIVNTAAQWGIHPVLNHIAYNVTKAAVASFTQNFARDYAPDKIRVKAICPSEIHTPMAEAGVKHFGRRIADLDKFVRFGRIGKPEEVAALVAFLASDEAACADHWWRSRVHRRSRNGAIGAYHAVFKDRPANLGVTPLLR